MASSDTSKDLKLSISDPSNGDRSLFRESAMTKRGAYAAISYMACAVLLVMFNKAAFSSYSFPSANVMTLVQMTSTCLFLFALRQWKIISFTTADPNTTFDDSISFKTFRNTLPLSVTYLIYMLASMESVRAINVPMYTTLRRTTVVFTMIMEYLLTDQKYSSRVIGSVALIVLGAFIAGARDLSFDPHGYAIIFICNISSAINLATLARVGKSCGLTSFGLIWCNGIVCAPFLLLLTYIQGDLHKTIDFPDLYSYGFQVVLFLSCIMSFAINYIIFLNTTLNSAVTQTVCGNLKDLFTIIFGWLMFGGLPFDLLNVTGQFLGFLGAGFYAYCKLTGK